MQKICKTPTLHTAQQKTPTQTLYAKQQAQPANSKYYNPYGVYLPEPVTLYGPSWMPKVRCATFHEELMTGIVESPATISIAIILLYKL